MELNKKHSTIRLQPTLRRYSGPDNRIAQATNIFGKKAAKIGFSAANTPAAQSKSPAKFVTSLITD